MPTSGPVKTNRGDYFMAWIFYDSTWEPILTRKETTPITSEAWQCQFLSDPCILSCNNSKPPTEATILVGMAN